MISSLIAILVLVVVLLVIHFVVAMFIQGRILQVIDLILGLLLLLYALNKFGFTF